MIIFYKVSTLCNHHTHRKSQNLIRFPEHSLLSPSDQYRLSPKGINNYSSDFYHFHYSACALWCLVSFTHWTLCLWDSFIFESWVVFCLFSLLYCVVCVIYDLFIHSVIDKQLNCFMFLTWMNNGVTNTFVQVFWGTLYALWWAYTKDRITD